MRKVVQPLETFPQLTIHETPKCGLVEYRIENWEPAGKNAGGDRPSSGWDLGHLVVPLLIFVVDRYITPDVLWLRALECLVAAWWLTHALVWESVIAIPGIGLQLESHYGLPHTPFSHPRSLGCKRQFIPLSSIMDVVLNEGLSFWEVRYYLAVVYREVGSRDGTVKVAVPFKAIRTYGVMLKEVYHGLRETLFDEYASDSDSGSDSKSEHANSSDQ
ncbi:hypothetical protein FRB90_000588 [Tulasnella sp. 427]|nr:hypothetical protein FRB90_000588 [Tulasnella sp. 427]